MKFEYIKDDDNKVIVHAPKKNELIDKIEELALSEDITFDGINFYGYLEDDIVPISLREIERFYIDDNKTFCSVGLKKYKLKMRLYQIEERLPENFIKINQSSIVNTNYIKRFNTSLTGTILIEMKSGDIDYVSRRMIKGLKERLGI